MLRASSARVFGHVSGPCTQTKCVLVHILFPYIACIRYRLFWAAGYAILSS